MFLKHKRPCFFANHDRKVQGGTPSVIREIDG